ncbi:YfhO family protein [Chitinophaga sp.]|uniref:YfhO family protein n=1 Tax=Chitinophaga sp. TaxID=1869181 RepID=UPI0039C87D70
MKTLDALNTRDSAVIDKRFEKQLGSFKPGADSTASIKLTKYGLNKLEYASRNSQEGFGVFSEIYYPAGWNAFIDGKPADIIRTDYALRGLKIPAGEHKIEMKFEPQTFLKGLKIANITSILLLLLVAASLVFEVLRQNKTGIAAEPAAPQKPKK